ncbi:hypothetical protein WMF18_07295 [Sorangium sp. So ce315]|uniref:hypothetical protein n=1 Tax=Sorangium sp. So ce315 TaxID=3133299 RepID=UPI003F614B6F
MTTNMSHRQQMLEALLYGLESLEGFRGPPEQIAPQFVAWVNSVQTALEAAGMRDAASSWQEASGRIRFSPDETSFPVHMATMKALLLGIIHRESGNEIDVVLIDPDAISEAPSCVQRVLVQANGCYQRGWFDASAVMIRRAVEVLLIECFEASGKAAEVKDGENYVGLKELIDAFLAGGPWHPTRGARSGLQKLRELKELGDRAAHARRFVANRNDIDRLAKDLRLCLQELAFIARASSRASGST